MHSLSTLRHMLRDYPSDEQSTVYFYNSDTRSYEPVTVRPYKTCCRKAEIIHYNGLSLSVAQWVEMTGIKECTLRGRIKSPKWSVGQALGFDPPPLKKSTKPFIPSQMPYKGL